jgi:hypothetical protein
MELTEEFLFARLGRLVIQAELQAQTLQDRDKEIEDLKAEKNGTGKKEVIAPTNVERK